MAGTDNHQTPAATVTKYSSRLWFIVHVAFPLVPFVLEVLLRFASTETVNFATFSASNLAMSMGILALFVSQSLANYNIPLNSGDRKDDIEFRKLCFVIGAIFCFAFFGALIVATDSTFKTLSIFVLFIAICIVLMAYKTQREFKLKAVL